MNECAPGCDYPVTGYHARRGARTLCPVVPSAVPVFLPLEGQCAAQGHPPRIPQMPSIAGLLAAGVRIGADCHCGHVLYDTPGPPEDAA